MAEKLNGENNEQGSMNQSEGSTNLQSFIATQIQQQEKVSRETDNLDTRKRENFIARALSESHRMSMEAERSRQKTENLHVELGERRMAQWSREHSAEVLQDQDSLADLTCPHD
ncbi:unnamed protein product [Candidula unifasciata]|uniref:Uncharacterized protein n=1 Tax=Candidula unifasciata TaxID=100452 RepID=A0A8S3ZJU8_9EUPU|nr:unnamed protein product [Candidula unifasciata]